MSKRTKTIIIAEVGVNHNGSLKLALELIDAAAAAGADVVKFQTFSAEQLSCEQTKLADYQKRSCGTFESQYDMLKTLELPIDFYPHLIKQCKKHNVQFMSSVFDRHDVDFLNSLTMSHFKIPSGEITNGPLLFEVAKTNSSVILSTGMASLSEIEQALMVLAYGFLHPNKQPSLDAFSKNWQHDNAHAVLADKVTLLHCTSDYPAALENVNLLAMQTLAGAFHVPIGYSDHTAGITIPLAAVTLGATVIEKHFTLDKNLAGPDHKASLEPQEFKNMVTMIREIELALGSPIKRRVAVEENTADVVRKSIIAQCNINEGELFTQENIAIKRAGKGLSPMHYWDLLGKKSTSSYEKSEIIS
jgi:N-acetylneuraminate synthase